MKYTVTAQYHELVVNTVSVDVDADTPEMAQAIVEGMDASGRLFFSEDVVEVDVTTFKVQAAEPSSIAGES